MVTSQKRPEAPSDPAQVLGELSRELNIPFDDVENLYREEFERLASSARISQFISLLAVKNTRRALRHDH